MKEFLYKAKIVANTLIFVFVISGIAFTLYTYENLKVQAAAPIEKPDFEHDGHQQFVDNINQCVEYIYETTSDVYPVNKELLIAQAALESAWGTSRFAVEGKNLFGIRTYDLREPHMLPWKDKPQKWGVKVFQHECDSVQNYMDILNNGTAFEKYRELRDDGEKDPFKLVLTLDAYASDVNYFSKVKSIIKKLRKEYYIG